MNIMWHLNVPCENKVHVPCFVEYRHTPFNSWTSHRKPTVTGSIIPPQVDQQTRILWSLWTEKKWEQCESEKGTKVNRSHQNWHWGRGGCKWANLKKKNIDHKICFTHGNFFSKGKQDLWRVWFYKRIFCFRTWIPLERREQLLLQWVFHLFVLSLIVSIIHWSSLRYVVAEMKVQSGARRSPLVCVAEIWVVRFPNCIVYQSRGWGTRLGFVTL